MKLWQWVIVWAWMWMARLGTIETAPKRNGTQTTVQGTSSKLFVDRPDFFDYPDSDQASLLAVARFINEKPIKFVNTGSRPGFFQRVLVFILVLAFFYLLFQFFMHVNFQKGS